MPSKTYKRHMSLYQHIFHFRAPYQILCTPAFVIECTAKKLQLADATQRTLLGATKLMSTACAYHELKKMDPAEYGRAAMMCKRMERRRCTHRTPVGGDECVRSIIGDANTHRYIAATQSKELRHELRRIPGVPIMFVSHGILALEPLSAATERMVGGEEGRRVREQVELDVRLWTREQIAKGKGKERCESADGGEAKRPGKEIKRKRRMPKAPNPLSVKRPKTEKVTVPTKEERKKSMVLGDEGDVVQKKTKRGKRGSRKKAPDAAQDTADTAQDTADAAQVTVKVDANESIRKSAASLATNGNLGESLLPKKALHRIRRRAREQLAQSKKK